MSIQSNFPNLQPSLLLDFANTKQLDNRVTFTRSTPAVYYDGKTTAVAEQNIFQQSQTFDNAYWTKYTGTITANSTTAPDGTSTADTFTEASGSVLPCFYVNAGSKQVNETFTLSVYAKANGRNYIWLKQRSGTNDYIVGIYDLSAPSVSKTQAGTNDVITSTSITSVGNGWYRLTLTGYLGGVTNGETLFGLSDTGTPTIDNEGNITAYTGNGTSGAYFWGAQFEARSSATAYTATTTQPITNYIPVLLTAGGNQPRFDCNPTTGESLGLLVEEQRTNLHLYSAAFNGSTYTVEAGNYLNNTIVSPSGGITGAAIIEGNTFYTRSTINMAVSNSTVYTYSAYFKKGLRSQALMEMYTNTNNGTVVFDLVAGTIVGGDVARATITNVGNGWYRCTLTSTTSGTSLSVFSYPAVNGSYSYTHVEGATGIFIWGAQVEAGSFASSYIATTSASATRTADAASMTGTNFSSWFNQAEGTFYANGCTNNSAPSWMAIMEINTTNLPQNNRYSLGVTSTAPSLYSLANGSVQANNLNSGVANMINGISGQVDFCYKINSYALSNNNSAVSTSTGLIPVVEQLFIGHDNEGRRLNGTLKKLAYYPIRVTNANLQALTS